MRGVCELINQGNHRDALVRLWVLATRRATPDDDLPLNVWERPPHSKAARSERTKALRASLQEGKDIDEAALGGEPLALVGALDAWLGRDVATAPYVERDYAVDGARYFLIPVPLTRPHAVGPARQANNPQSWFRHHRVVPASIGTRLRVNAIPSRDVTDLRLREIKAKNSLRILLLHFDDDAVLVPPPTGRFFATGLSDEAARLDGIARAVERAAADEADLVVLPELSVTPGQRELLKAMLARAGGHQPCLVVAGSFHEERNGRRVNVSELLGGDGRRVLTHEKLRPFGLADGLAEDIHAADTLTLLVTPLGTFALAICKDFCDELGPIDFAILPVDWWLVPSMGDQATIDAHLDRARTVWRVLNRAASVVANQETAGGPKRPGFVFFETQRDGAVGGTLFEVVVEPAQVGRGHH